MLRLLFLDYNRLTKSRCVQLVWSYDDDNPTAWADLINKVKDGILSAFDATVTQREEEVKRSEGQRTMPGWNFCTFFILKVRFSRVILDGNNECQFRKVLQTLSKA